MFILNDLNLACLLGLDHEEIRERKNALPPWVLFTSFEGYGILPEEKVAYEETDFKAMAQSFALKPEEMIPGAKAEEVLQLLRQPSTAVSRRRARPTTHSHARVSERPDTVHHSGDCSNNVEPVISFDRRRWRDNPNSPSCLSVRARLIPVAGGIGPEHRR